MTALWPKQRLFCYHCFAIRQIQTETTLVLLLLFCNWPPKNQSVAKLELQNNSCIAIQKNWYSLSSIENGRLPATAVQLSGGVRLSTSVLFLDRPIPCADNCLSHQFQDAGQCQMQATAPFSLSSRMIRSSKPINLHSDLRQHWFNKSSSSSVEIPVWISISCWFLVGLCSCHSCTRSARKCRRPYLRALSMCRNKIDAWILIRVRSRVFAHSHLRAARHYDVHCKFMSLLIDIVWHPAACENWFP